MVENQSAENKRLAEEMVDKFAQLITSGFGLVAALAWNEAIQDAFRRFFPADTGGGLIAKVCYAVIVTLLVVVIVWQLSRIANRIKSGIERKRNPRI